MELFSLIVKAVGPLKETASYVFRKWWPPKYGYKLAHSNILELIKPYVYQAKVIELLGQPHEWDNYRTGYRFANAFLQVNYSGESVESVALVLLRQRWPNRFKVFPLKFSLGCSTFKDVCQDDARQNKLVLKRRFSSKFYCLWSEQYFGNLGRYLYYSFALLEADTFPFVSMPTSDFASPESLDVDEKVTLNDVGAKFNAISISRNEGEDFCFDFTLFR